MTYLLALLLTLFGYGPAPSGLASASDMVSIPLDESTARSSPVPLPAVTPARGDNPPLVVIDAGHGGRDPGAPSAVGIQEKDLTLALARSIRDALASSGRVRVALTRDGDLYLPLDQRYEIARRLGADLFVSLHADASADNEDARGATVYTLSEVASDQEAALLAQRENEAGTAGGVALSRDPNVNLILIDLAQRESMDVSARFAQFLYREASPLFRFQSNWHRFAAFVVLKAPDVPSVLFESGYVSNRDDVAYLASPEGRRDVAAGFRRAIEAHFASRFLRERTAAAQ